VDVVQGAFGVAIPDDAVVRSHFAGEDVQQGGLAGTGFADDGEDFGMAPKCRLSPRAESRVSSTILHQHG
jgi:hypothetical protein